nr:probable beta-D-xylosidase 7 [Ipomoea batatas]
MSIGGLTTYFQLASWLSSAGRQACFLSHLENCTLFPTPFSSGLSIRLRVSRLTLDEKISPSASEYPASLSTRRSLHPPPSIPPHSRREDLSIRLRVSRLTLVNAVPAGIPAYVQPVVGVANVEKCISLIGPISPSTSFPQVILITAASFDEDLLYHIFQSIYRSKSQLFVEGQAGTTTQMEWEREKEGLYLGEKAGSNKN